MPPHHPGAKKKKVAYTVHVYAKKNYPLSSGNHCTKCGNYQANGS